MKYYKPWLIFGYLLMTVLFIGSINNAIAQSSRTKYASEIKQINKLLTKITRVEEIDTKAAFALITQAKKLCAVVKIDTLNAKVYLEEGFCNFYSGNYKRAITS